MDPDACLRELLDLLEQLSHGDEDIRDTVTEKLRALARWLERGGFPPNPQKLKTGGGV